MGERGASWGGPWWSGRGLGAIWCECPSGEYNPLVACVRGLLGWPPSGPWSGRGLWVVARPVVARVGGDKYPKPRREQNLALLGRGRGALPAVAAIFMVGARGGGVAAGGGAPSFGCAWWCWGRGAFPLVVGLGWW